MIVNNKYKIEFPVPQDERFDLELDLKGRVEINVIYDNYIIYNITFIAATRLMQDIEDEFHDGKPCFEDYNLVVVPSLTIDNIYKSIDYLSKTNYFIAIRHDGFLTEKKKEKSNSD